MKIAQISAVFPPYKGGIGQVAYFYALELSSQGEGVVVFTPDYNGKKETSGQFAVRYLKPWFAWGKAGFCPQLFWQLSKFDVVQLHFPAFGLAEVVALWKAVGGKGKLFVFYHHDLRGKGWWGRFFSWYKKIVMPFVLRQADKIIVSSFDYARHSDLAGFYAKHQDKFVALPFGVREKLMPTDNKPELKQAKGIPQAEKVILFVGGLDRNHYFKGVEVLLRAVSKLKQSVDWAWRLVVVGDGDLRPAYQQLAAELQINDKVFFVGSQTETDLIKFYQLADVLVLPSIDQSEAFGLVLIEAMACGCPVIASNLPGVRWVVNESQAGKLVQPNDADSLKQALVGILSDDGLHQSLSRQAVNFIRNGLTWPLIGKKLLSIYKQ